jgi:hypothetical protein
MCAIRRLLETEETNFSGYNLKLFLLSSTSLGGEFVLQQVKKDFNLLLKAKLMPNCATGLRQELVKSKHVETRYEYSNL